MYLCGLHALYFVNNLAKSLSLSNFSIKLNPPTSHQFLRPIITMSSLLNPLTNNVIAPITNLTNNVVNPVTNITNGLPAALGNLPPQLLQGLTSGDVSRLLTTLFGILSTLGSLIIDPLVDYGLAAAGFIAAIIMFFLTLVICDRFRRWTWSHAFILFMSVFSAVAFGIYMSTLYVIFTGNQSNILGTVESFSVFAALTQLAANFAMILRLRWTIKWNAWTESSTSRHMARIKQLAWIIMTVAVVILFILEMIGLLVYNVDNVNASPLFFMFPKLNSNPNAFPRVYPWITMVVDVLFMLFFTRHLWIEVRGPKDGYKPVSSCPSCRRPYQTISPPSKLRGFLIIFAFIIESNVLNVITSIVLAVVSIKGYNFNQVRLILD